MITFIVSKQALEKYAGPLLPMAPYDTHRLFTKAGSTPAAMMAMFIAWLREPDGSSGNRAWEPWIAEFREMVD